MSKKAHGDAILGLLRANDDLTVFPVPDGQPGSLQGLVPPNTPPPYVAVHISGGPLVSDTIDRRSSRYRVFATCHCAGESRDAALLVADMVEATLLDVRPVLTGRSAVPIRHDSDRAAAVDESVSPPVWTVVDVYRLESV